jgi:aryl-alcohol dehydrogenase-like predicted oxidoreductase
MHLPEPTATTKACATRLGLGTVQFGQAYGVSNARGQVPAAEVAAIIAMARGASIALLDTAAGYGEAEAVLSAADTNGFRIVTKTIAIGNGVEAVIARARRSAEILGHADTLLVHAAGDLKTADGPRLWKALQGLRDEGVFRRIGISAYVADDPVALAKKFRPDVMQIPFSLLDQRLVQSGALAALKDMGVEIHARSLFLQGLLFLPPERLPEKLRPAAPALARVQQLIAGSGATALSAALSFALSHKEIDHALVGVTAASELHEIIAAPMVTLDWRACALSDELVLTPSRW